MKGQVITPRVMLRRIGLYLFCCLVLVFFTVPLLWLVVTPFQHRPQYYLSFHQFTLENFRTLYHNPYALKSLKNSLYLAVGTAALVVVASALAAYALSRVRIAGRDILLYLLLLFSSIVTGTAAMVPIYQLMFQLQLIDKLTGVALVIAGGLMPAAIFILKDFIDATPRSYEESARVFGATPLQVLRHVVVPVVRPGLATIAVWAVVNVWGNFLLPYILLVDVNKQPGAVVLYTFYTEAGQPRFDLIAAFSLVYSLPVVLLYLFVSRRYGFRFHGGIKR